MNDKAVSESAIERDILVIRGHKVMLDTDLARLYGVETGRLNEAVKRNRSRFPEDFMFQLTVEEAANLRSQIAISSFHGGRRYLPLAFTEQGIAMLSSVLNRIRCPWPKDNARMQRYHDEEWGVPVHDDRKHFEFLILEGAQAGLSWQTILNRREGYRKAFAGFDPKRVAKFGARDIERLMHDAGIIRNRQKIEAAIRNAKAFLAVQREFGSFDAYVWPFVGGKPKRNAWRSIRQLPATSSESDAFSKDLKQRGFGFVGSTTMYAHMQAVGMVNDHLVGCFRYKLVAD